MDGCQSYVANQYIADVFVHVCVPFSWIESHSYNIILPAKPWSSELVSPNVAKILAKRRDRVRAVFERRLARIDRVRPKFLKRDKQEIRNKN